MSLEANIAELTAAVKELTAQLRVIHPHAPAELPKIEAPVKEGKEAPKSESATTPKSSPQSAQTPTKSSEESQPAVSYKEVGDCIIAISKMSRDKAIATLARFGAKSGKDLKPEQYPAFIAYCAEVIRGKDPEAGDA